MTFILPNEAPIAAFLAKKQPWVLESQCAGHDDVFLPDVLTPKAVAHCRDICAVCPVRIECGEQSLTEEGNSDIANRFYVRAYMTPGQRLSVHRRGGLKGRDPMKLVKGDDNGRSVPPIPDEGDRWSKHHLTLARKLIRWMSEACPVGQKLPASAVIQEHLGCNPAPLQRVLEALVQDGTLDMIGDSFLYRGGRNVLGWLPPHLAETPATLEDAHG